MIKRYLQFVKPYKYRIFATIIVGIIKFGIPMLIPLLIKYAIDGVINNHALTTDEKVHHLTIAIGIALFIFVIVRPPIEFIRQYLAQWTSNKILYDIRKKLYNHLQALSARFYANNQVGQVISRVINDVEQTKDFILTGLMNIWLDWYNNYYCTIHNVLFRCEIDFSSTVYLPILHFNGVRFLWKIKKIDA